jgi:putative phosphonate metabolism protein
MAGEHPRYAIYYAPEPMSALWRFGCGVIGYDAASGTDVPFSTTGGQSIAEWSIITEEPRRYGFHATMKAPFELADPGSEGELLRRVAMLASCQKCVEIEEVQVATLSRFVALTAVGDVTPMMTLASKIVEGLDDLRAPLTEADRARRLAASLSARQKNYLDLYGYPYVREEFRFHMTLTGAVRPPDIERLRSNLERHKEMASISGPVPIAALTVFRQFRRDARFRIIARFPLGTDSVTSRAIA